MEKANILNILRSKNTVFSFKEILLASQDKNPNLLIRRLNYYVKKGELYSIRKGLYAKDFETVLGKAGVTFQYYGQIFIASYLTREITTDRQTYSFRKIKDYVLTDNAGIKQKDNYSIAIPERAFLDVIYLKKDYHFDNLSVLDWDKVFEILPIYTNKRMEREVKAYQKIL